MDDAEFSEFEVSRPALESVPGIDRSTVKSLASVRVSLVQHLLAWPENELCRLAGIEPASLREAYNAVYAQFSARRENARELHQQTLGHPESSSLTCDPLCQQIHKHVLDIRRPQIVELVGTSGTAKTQLCLTVAASVLAVGRGVVLLDSSACLSTERIRSILHARNFSAERVQRMIGQIIHCPVPSLDHAMKTLGAFRDDLMAIRALNLGGFARDQCANSVYLHTAIGKILANVGLTVFDSPTSLLSCALGWKRRDGWTGYAYECMFASLLRQITQYSDAPALITNRLIKGDKEISQRPALGRGWTHVPDVRVYLEEAADFETNVESVQVLAKTMSKSAPANLPVLFQVTSLGVVEKES